MPRQYSMDNRSAASAATRARLLDAAVDVLAEVGGAALTMQMVADTADVALRTVYNHFPSKEVLVVAAYQRLADATQDRGEHAAAFGRRRGSGSVDSSSRSTTRSTSRARAPPRSSVSPVYPSSTSR